MPVKLTKYELQVDENNNVSKIIVGAKFVHTLTNEESYRDKEFTAGSPGTDFPDIRTKADAETVANRINIKEKVKKWLTTVPSGKSVLQEMKDEVRHRTGVTRYEYQKGESGSIVDDEVEEDEDD